MVRFQVDASLFGPSVFTFEVLVRSRIVAPPTSEVTMDIPSAASAPYIISSDQDLMLFAATSTPSTGVVSTCVLREFSENPLKSSIKLILSSWVVRPF